MTVDFDEPDRQRQRGWIDAVLDALCAEPAQMAGLMSAHFHVSADGTKVINYAEWSSEQAHIDSIALGSSGGGGTDSPERRSVMELAGTSDIKRYRDYRTVAVPPGGPAIPAHAPTLG